MEELAAAASKPARRALLIRFDSRTGHRSAELFEDGERRRSFGDADELYVPLDESGEPVLTAAPLRFADLDPEQEYETIENAIQLGLKAFGRGDWKTLFALITAA
jgi:hypothetical protein